MIRPFWRAASDAGAAALFRFPLIERAVVPIGRRVWDVPGVGRFYRGVVWRLRQRLFEAPPRFRRVRTEAGVLTLNVTEFTCHTLYYGGPHYEPATARCLRARLSEGSVFVDVGANHGYFTVMAASMVGPRGRVFAFEPNPAVVAQLERHLALNGLAGRVTILPLALSDQPAARVPLFVSLAPENSGLSSLAPWPESIARGELSLGHAVDVAADTFDNWWRAAGSPGIDLVKIDVEGAEARVARGMAQALASGRIRAIICETVPGSEFDRDLRARGFTATRLDPIVALANMLYERGADPA
jgi:FkbM family methyltransferase